MQDKTIEQRMEDLREDEVQRLRNRDRERIQKVGDDLPRYNALSLTEKLLDRGDVMKAVPTAVVETMKEAAEVINFFLGQMQTHSAHMDGKHRYRFISDGWPMTHCVGPNREEAVGNAIKAINTEKSKSKMYIHITNTETVDQQSGKE